MPLYSYKCLCGEEFKIRIPIYQHKDLQSCPKCSQMSSRIVGGISFLQRGDGWIGKNIKIKKQMAKKNEKLNGKSIEMKQDAPNMRLAPNVEGERVDSWADAQRLAKSKGKNTSTYDSLVRKERP